MPDEFQSFRSALTSPATKAFAITPNDGADLATNTRGIWIGNGGSIAFIAADDSAAVTMLNVQDGSLLPIRAKRVLATGTTATGIVGLL